MVATEVRQCRVISPVACTQPPTSWLLQEGSDNQVGRDRMPPNPAALRLRNHNQLAFQYGYCMMSLTKPARWGLAMMYRAAPSTSSSRRMAWS